MALRKAIKTARMLRVCIVGVTGGGKTYTALRFAKGIAKTLGPTAKIALLDTERSSASLYADTFDFLTDDITTGSPQEFLEGLKACREEEVDVVIIDSLSHAWIGVEGALARVDAAAKKSKSGNTFNAWREVTPEHNALVTAILDYPGHIIVTLRSKMAYELVENDRGKKVPVKLGLQPVMRDGVEYEFDLVGDVDQNHNFSVTKTRYPAFDGKVLTKPGEDFGAELVRWLHDAPKPIEGMDGREIREEFARHNARLGDQRFNALVPEHPKTLGAARLALSVLREEPDAPKPQRPPNTPVTGVPPDIKLCANEGCGAPLPKGRRDELCETCRIDEALASSREQEEEILGDDETAWGAVEEMEQAAAGAVEVMQEAKEVKAEAEREEAKARHEAREKKPWEKHTVAPGRAE